MSLRSAHKPTWGLFSSIFLAQEEPSSRDLLRSVRHFWRRPEFPYPSPRSLWIRDRLFLATISLQNQLWKTWLDLNEKLFAVCEGPDGMLKQSLTEETGYPGSVQRKVFLMERIASLLLAIQPDWRVRTYNTFDCAWSASRLNQFRLELVLSDALKIAMREQGFHDYHEAYAEIRDQLR